MPYKVYRLTLIEVIVVLSFTILLSILIVSSISALGVSRESRRKCSCTNNLKMIGLSLRMYSNVYDEQFPDRGGREGLEMLASNGFLENTQVYECASTKDDVKDTTYISSNASYCYAGALNEADSVDSALSSDRANNHDKYGNILFVDGHVKGYAGASWSSNRGETILTDF